MMKFEIQNIKDLGDKDFERAFQNLSEPQKERCLRFKFEADRRRLAFGEELLRELMKKELACKDEDITLAREASGRPVAKVKGEALCVSITHSGDYVACAMSDKAVGIDLEVMREITPQFIKRILSDNELEFVGAGDKESLSEEEIFRFLKLWTAKEAFVKLTGKGLSGLGEAEVLPLIKNENSGNLKIATSHSKTYACTVIFE